jgi:DNA segregation ATPase FtsK/SpoIIIE-like protein
MRAIAVGPSGSGKTVFIQSLIVDLMRTRGGGSCFLHIYVWSPSILLDPVWATVREFAKKVLKQEDDCFFSEFHTQDLQAVIDKQQKLITQLKERGTKMLPNILVVVDDFADDAAVARRETLLHQLFMRGRHSKISTLISTQKYRALAPQMRTQALSFFIFKLRSQQELDALLDEVSALGGRKLVDSFYREATRKPYSFLYIRLDQPEPMFMERFDFVLTP